MVTARAEDDCLALTEISEGERRPGEQVCSDAAGSSLPKQPLGVASVELAPGSLCGRTDSRMAQSAGGRHR